MGLDVPWRNAIAFVEALALVGMERRLDVYWAGRATLVRRPEDIPAYDRGLRRVLGRTAEDCLRTALRPRSSIALDADDGADGPEGAERRETTGPTVVVR